ncbi:MAG: hypothetical protein ACP5GY_09240 [Vulcanisaeta sp.]
MDPKRRFHVRRRLRNLLIKDLNMYFIHNGIEYRLLIKRDDCVKILLINEDREEIIETKCMGRESVDLITLLKILNTDLMN